MLKNYLKIAFRTLIKNKVFSLINVLGLSIGLAASILIFIYVQYERSYDEFHVNNERIYRVALKYNEEGKLILNHAKAPGMAGEHIVEEFPEVINHTQFINIDGVLGNFFIRYKENSFPLDQAIYANENFFKIFSFELLKGNEETALKEVNSIVLSESAAERIFGDQDPMNKFVTLNEEETYKVTGIYKDFPGNSHIRIDHLFSLQTLFNQSQFNVRGWWDHYTYILTQPGVDPEELESKFPEIIEKHFPMFEGMSFYLQPLDEIHLYSNLDGEMQVNGNARTVNFLIVIAGLILIIAWINYISLSTALATNRRKEVGIRKSIGATKSNLSGQFVLETLLINLLAAALALTAIQFSMPLFEDMLGKQLEIDLMNSFWLFVAGFILLGIFLSALYPAMVQSSYSPVKALKGEKLKANKGIGLRKALVVFQYLVSLSLIALTITVYRQLNFMRSQDLGINIDRTMIVKAPSVYHGEDFAQKLGFFQNELKKHASIKKISSSSSVPGKEILWGMKVKTPQQEKTNLVDVVAIDHNFLDLFEIDLIAGENFHPEKNNRQKLLINESMLTTLEIDQPEEAINQKVLIPEFEINNFEIVGVIRDYHHLSLKKTIDPAVYLYRNFNTSFSMKVNTDDLSEVVGYAEKKYKEAFEANPFEYFFLDDFFDSQYREDQRFGDIFAIFSGLAIFIACIGLFGLSLFTSFQRTKEIGIRKTLGASISDIFAMMSGNFLKLILIAVLIGFPLIYFLLRNWLNNYPVRISLDWSLLVLPALLVLFISLLTVSYQSFRAARTNPVDSLKHE